MAGPEEQGRRSRPSLIGTGLQVLVLLLLILALIGGLALLIERKATPPSSGENRKPPVARQLGRDSLRPEAAPAGR